MFLPIHIQFIGEESVYAVYLQNMLQTHDYFNAFYRPPLFLWAGLALQETFHFSSIELPLRIVSILCSLGSAAFSGLFAHKVFKKEHAGLIAALVFLTLGEIQFWYGWFGYADAMFLFFIFSSTVCLWLAAQFRQTHWYILAIILINLAFLTKALTAYAFFISTMIIVTYHFKAWRFFLHPIRLILLSGIIIAPMLWASFHGSSSSSASASLIHDIAMRFHSIDILSYLKHIMTFPIEFIARMAPVSFIILFFLWKKNRCSISPDLRMILLIVGINYLPYWLAPFSNMRHVVPLYAWASLALSYYLIHSNIKIKKAALIGVTIALMLKIPFSLWGLPFLKERDASQKFRPVAANIIQQVGNATIRQSSVSFTGFAIVAYINEAYGLKKNNIQFLTPNDHRVYVIAHTPLRGAELIKTYTLFGDKAYLLYLR